MTVSELVKCLEEIRQKYGDIDIRYYDSVTGVTCDFIINISDVKDINRLINKAMPATLIVD